MVNQETILKRVAELYRTYGIKVCSMDDVARACGISKRTLYGIFANKYELIETFVAGLTGWFSTEYLEMRRKAPTAIHEVYNALNIIEPLYRRLPYRMFVDLERHYYQIWRKLDSFRNEAGLDLAVGNISRGIQEGLFTGELDSEKLAQMRLWQLDAIHKHASETGTLHELLHHATTHYLRGMATEEGNHVINEFITTNSIITENQQ